ncbi:MAG: hypothetical protein HKN11_18530 [Rhizobiales bacterium]|nr:hypothetical protein [Hyphomicrobiales bacterium]
MSDLHSETITVVCANPQCTCQFPTGTGHREGDQVFCNERCADPKMTGCGHDDCPCNDDKIAVAPPIRAS